MNLPGDNVSHDVIVRNEVYCRTKRRKDVNEKKKKRENEEREKERKRKNNDAYERIIHSVHSPFRILDCLTFTFILKIGLL